MNINNIIKFTNDKLAGETLMYDQLLVFLDATIDDINSSLNSQFPVFSEFTSENENYPNYNFFPDKYIRTVVIPGAAAKFYAVDEEGAQVAPMFDTEYRQNLFFMVRDYSHLVPEEYRCEEQGFMIDYTAQEAHHQTEHIRGWFDV